MTTLRLETASNLLANVLAHPDRRRAITGALAAAGEATATVLSGLAPATDWTHSLDFRCEPAGRQVVGLESASVMDTQEELAGTMLVGCRSASLDDLSRVLVLAGLDDDDSIGEQALEATNIVGSAYLNGLRAALYNETFSTRCFLPSPPRFLRSPVETMIELAIGGQALGDRGWIADHRFTARGVELALVWIPTASALVALGAVPDRGAAQ